ncbi:MAG TPA: extracellular solute-binding protein [Roseiarcus sp.]|jgi:multiple sugar transport system substrate-binding protein
MNELELLRVIEYLERMRRPYRALFPMADEDSVWNILSHLVKSHLRGDLVTISALAAVANVPYATALRRIHTMTAEGQIERRPRGPKTFSLHPSERTLEAFLSYAQHIKSLLAQVMGVRPAEEEADDYYIGGSRLEAQLAPPQTLSRRRSEGGRLRFLLHDDNYFASMQNLWADFRANRGSRRDFDLYPLPELYRRASENAAKPVSDYDVIVLNVPWLGEFVEAGRIRRAEPFLYYSGIDSLDFDPRVWATGRWKGRQEAVPAFSSIELFAARSDLIDGAGLAYPKTFADVLEIGRAFHAPRRGFFGVAWNACRGMPLASTFAFHIGCCGGAVLQTPRGRSDWSIGDIDPREIAVGVDTEAGRQALDHLREMLAISPPNVLDLDWNSSLEIFMSGHAAMAYCWSMRAARFEYDVRSRVKRRVRYLPQPAGPKGANVTPLGGFVLAVPANLPEARVEAAFEAIRWMTSREAIQTHIKTGFPVLPRFSMSADPEIAAGSPIVYAVNELARRDLLQTWQRAPLPQYACIEAVIGDEIHSALRGDKSPEAALRDAQASIERLLKTSAPARAA